MADEKHLEILRKGVEVWNQWRKENPDIKPNLKNANLNCANLKDANFHHASLKDTNLHHANLKAANLYRASLNCANLKAANLHNAKLIRSIFFNADLFQANLKGANLESAYIVRANLKDANLKGAKLKRVQALETNFEGATLTGTCIEDWNINSKTNLKDVKCDYIFLKGLYSEEEKKFIYSDRLPYDPDKIFAPGEFTQLFQKALETVELIFSEGIEWTAFLDAFQQLQAEVKSEELAIQAIEKKSGGAFVIRLEVPQEADKAEIEKYIKREYDAKVKVIEANYQKQLEMKDETIQDKNELIKAYREEKSDLLEVVKTMSKINPVINIVNDNKRYSAETAGILHNENGDISGNAKVASEINEAGKQDH